jgi:hypothetical protein
LEVAKWLVVRFNLTVEDIRTDNDYAFYCSCVNGHLETAKWLVSITADVVRSNANYVLCWSCSFGHLELAKWLTERFDLDTSVLTENQLTNLKRWITGIQGLQRSFFGAKTSAIQRIVLDRN